MVTPVMEFQGQGTEGFIFFFLNAKRMKINLVGFQIGVMPSKPT